MALNMATDTEFDEALNWLAKKEKKTKSDIIRELVMGRLQNRQEGFHFGALGPLVKNKKPSSRGILKELKHMDEDDDLG